MQKQGSGIKRAVLEIVDYTKGLYKKVILSSSAVKELTRVYDIRIKQLEESSSLSSKELSNSWERISSLEARVSSAASELDALRAEKQEHEKEMQEQAQAYKSRISSLSQDNQEHKKENARQLKERRAIQESFLQAEKNVRKKLEDYEEARKKDLLTLLAREFIGDENERIILEKYGIKSTLLDELKESQRDVFYYKKKLDETKLRIVDSIFPLVIDSEELERLPLMYFVDGTLVYSNPLAYKSLREKQGSCEELESMLHNFGIKQEEIFSQKNLERKKGFDFYHYRVQEHLDTDKKTKVVLDFYGIELEHGRRVILCPTRLPAERKRLINSIEEKYSKIKERFIKSLSSNLHLSVTILDKIVENKLVPYKRELEYPQ